MNIVTVGINLAKNVFDSHSVDQSGKAVFIKPKVVCGQLLEMVAHLPPSLIGMEACYGAPPKMAKTVPTQSSKFSSCTQQRFPQQDPTTTHLAQSGDLLGGRSFVLTALKYPIK